jgi:O-antigen ligase
LYLNDLAGCINDDKNMSNSIANNSRNSYVFFSILLVMVSLLISRASLSIAMGIFLALTIVHRNFISQLKKFTRDRLLLLISLLFFIPLFSGLWSRDLQSWADIARLKLPLVLLPLAFAGDWQLSSRQWVIAGCCFVMVVFLGATWSLLHFLNNPGATENYLRARLIDTPLDNDHVRFSWMVAVAIICATLLYRLVRKPWLKIIFAATGIFFMIYLHILAARTGVFSFYIFLLAAAIHLLLKFRNKLLSSAALAALILVPTCAWLLLPTFQNRVKYLVYDIGMVNNEQFLPGSNDGARILSIRAGWDLLKAFPFGAGAGDLKSELNSWYTVHAPQMPVEERFYPCNEWLMYGGFAGWPAVALFSLILLYPLAIRGLKYKFYWISFHIVAALSFVFDMGLEVQYGIFLYSFILLWWYKWFKAA